MSHGLSVNGLLWGGDVTGRVAGRHQHWKVRCDTELLDMANFTDAVLPASLRADRPSVHYGQGQGHDKLTIP
jgi:hypothetical protein